MSSTVDHAKFVLHFQPSQNHTPERAARFNTGIDLIVDALVRLCDAAKWDRFTFEAYDRPAGLLPQFADDSPLQFSHDTQALYVGIHGTRAGVPMRINGFENHAVRYNPASTTKRARALMSMLLGLVRYMAVVALSFDATTDLNPIERAVEQARACFDEETPAPPTLQAARTAVVVTMQVLTALYPTAVDDVKSGCDAYEQGGVEGLTAWLKTQRGSR